MNAPEYAEYGNGGRFALETVELSKRFGAVRAVDELSISIPRGGMTSIVGPNGSGKSTLVNLLSGTLPLDEGIVIIEGTRTPRGPRARNAGARTHAHVPRGAAIRPDKRYGQHPSRPNRQKSIPRAVPSEPGGRTRQRRETFWKASECGTSATRWRWIFPTDSANCWR